jgi:hypothetical protein
MKRFDGFLPAIVPEYLDKFIFYRQNAIHFAVSDHVGLAD